MPRLFTTCLPLVATALGLLTAVSAEAGQRRFTYSYETLTAPKGTLELENIVTFKRSALHDDNFNVWEFRHEIEYGVTSRFQLALYVADWEFAPREGADGQTHRSARYAHTGVEVIYNLSNPNTDWLGSALYGEVVVGDRLVELEGKLLLQKNLGPFNLVYNAILEAVWEGAHLDEKKGEFAQTLGVSYQVHPSFSVGAELLHEIDIPGWHNSDAAGAGLYFGPNASFRAKNFYATATALWRTTDNPGEPDLQARLIIGLEF